MPTHDGLIIGGGISGLALAHWLGLHANPGTWELWEASDRLGGTIGTDRANGYSVDWGPNGFLDREPLTLQLVDEIGLRDSLEPANDQSEARFIVKNGRLHPVPFSPPAIITTGLLNPAEKLRIFAEPFIRARRDDSDESVFDFAARRIGRGAAETFVDPMVSGVYGGVAKELSLPSCFPIMREMEVQYGGLVRAMIAKMRQKKREQRAAGVPKKKSGSAAGPGGRLTSFRSGLDVLVMRMGERLKPLIRLSRSVQRITRLGDSWQVTAAGCEPQNFRHVILACPTFSAAHMLREFDRELAIALDAIPYAPIVVVATGHRREDITHNLNGFGFLIPRTQNLRCLGSIWTSSIFADRAPGGHIQFRTMLGGAGDPSVMELTDDQLWQTIRSELNPLLGIKADPVFTRIYRWQQGIPQYTLGHRERRTKIEQLTAHHPGLSVVGNAFYGVGLNDCVKMAHRLAQKIRTPQEVPA
ncbi:MAG: protoporphyrinogen oxidase [candidate division Zixibacteria bacterium]|nr:protoporphyrinogen oxidase [candidate division Zixibacteria bacterium]